MNHAALMKRLGRAGIPVLPLLVAFQSANGQGRLYWTEPENPAIMSSNFDGTSQKTVAQGFALEWPVDMDIDQVTGWVYWADQGTYRISRISPDGRDGDVIFPDSHAPYGIAVDGTNDYLYWTEQSAVKRSRLDGSDPVSLVTSFEWPRALEISVADDFMFWSIESGGTYRSKLDGTDVQQISSEGDHYLAVDDVHKNVFIASGMHILRTSFDGAVADTVVKSSSYIFALAVEPAADRLCWAQRAPVPLGGTAEPAELMCASSDGSGETKLLEITGAGVPEGLAINRSSRMIYLSTDQGNVHLRRCKYDGSGLENLTSSMIQPVDVAVDPIEDKVYWVDGRYPRYFLSRSDLDGSNSEDVEIQLPGPLPPLDGLDVLSAIALDATNRSIYVGTEGSIGVPTTLMPARIIMGPMDGPVNNVIESGSYESIWDIETSAVNGKVYYVGHLGELWQRNLDGSNPVLLKTAVGSGIAVSSNYLYWLDLTSKTLRRANLDGTQSVDLLSGVEPIRDLVVDESDTNLWWTTPGGTTIMRHRIGEVSAGVVVSRGTPIEGLFAVSSPSNVTQIAPLDGAADLPTTVTLTWTHPPDAQRFDVQVASGSNVADVIFASNTPNTEETFVAPLAETSYNWRVRSVGVGGEGPWTPYIRFTVGGSGPLAASLVEPSYGQTGVGVDPTFRWVKAPEAVSHQLQVADNISFSAPLIDVDSLTDDTFTAATLDHEHTYYWRVAGHSDDGKQTFSTAWPFTTVISAPQAVILVSPANHATDVPTSTSFTWQAATGAASYRLELATDSLFAGIGLDVETDEESYDVSVALAYKTRYYWRVRGINDGGDGAWSETSSFTTAIGAPAAVTLVSPDASATGVPAYATFTWQAASDASSYRLEVASDNLFAQIVLDEETAEQTYTLGSPLAYDTQYYWRVRGKNDAGDGEWSETRTFRTAIGTATDEETLPSDFAVYQNYPNPFRQSTQIRYDMPRPEHVSIVVFDAVGREIERMVDGFEPAGTHVVTFRAVDRPGGLYIGRIQAGSFERVWTMVVVR